jgi:polysaccharide lyase-like protein
MLRVAGLLAASLFVIAPSGGQVVERPHGLGDHGFPAVGKQLFGDFGTSGDLVRRWGAVDCADPTRVVFHGTGGDEHSRADGAGQQGPGYWRLTVRDGDDFYGERCELGLNNRDGPTTLYHEGQRRITFLSLRLRDRFPLYRGNWQAVMQMKQAQPADAGGGSPVLELDAEDGRWHLYHDGKAIGAVGGEIWSAPARRSRGVRFAFDVRYSADPRIGTVRVYADLNGDGDAKDPHERSERIRLATLKREIAGDDSDGYADGDPIASHLRVGIYHDAAYRCRTTECAIDVDNVAVYQP